MRIMLKSKIHRAKITDSDLHYVGSISIDENLMKAADILPWEQVAIYNITNGQRFSTYAIPAEAGSSSICINGAAARCVQKGDLIIIATYAMIEEDKQAGFMPQIVYVDNSNRIVTD